MIFKRAFASFGLKYADTRFKNASPIFKYELKRGMKIWDVLRYPVVPFKLTDIGEGIKEVTVKRCYIVPRQRVSQFEDICDVESDKATVTITSRFDGLVKNVYFRVDDVIAVGSTLLDIEVDNDDDNDDHDHVEFVSDPIVVAETRDGRADEIAAAETNARTGVGHRNQSSIEDEFVVKALCTPAVRRIAKDYGVDINRVTGTGKQGRVTKEDILLYLNQPRVDDDDRRPADEPATAAAATVAAHQPTDIPITAYRRVMFRTMTESNKIPTLTLSDEIDVTRLEKLRQSLKILLENDKVKLTLLAFWVKAVSLSLREYPALNATLEGETIRLAEAHNLGIAVNTPAGLVVPNIKRVQTLSVRQIAAEIQRLQKSASESRLTLADTSGGTFTLSNIGSIGGTIVKPLILPPQVALVGIGRIRPLPRFDGDDVVKKCLIINASWAADHRIIDGATVARFSNSVKRYLENPGLLAVDA